MVARVQHWAGGLDQLGAQHWTLTCSALFSAAVAVFEMTADNALKGCSWLGLGEDGCLAAQFIVCSVVWPHCLILSTSG